MSLRNEAMYLGWRRASDRKTSASFGSMPLTAFFRAIKPFISSICIRDFNTVNQILCMKCCKCCGWVWPLVLLVLGLLFLLQDFGYFSMRISAITVIFFVAAAMLLFKCNCHEKHEK
jgi:hypothetical protein